MVDHQHTATALSRDGSTHQPRAASAQDDHIIIAVGRVQSDAVYLKFRSALGANAPRHDAVRNGAGSD